MHVQFEDVPTCSTVKAGALFDVSMASPVTFRLLVKVGDISGMDNLFIDLVFSHSLDLANPEVCKSKFWANAKTRAKLLSDESHTLHHCWS